MSELLPENAPGYEDLAHDLIWGVKAIAVEIGKTDRQTFHLADTGAIPVAKIGGRIVASRSQLRAHFRALLGATSCDLPKLEG